MQLLNKTINKFLEKIQQSPHWQHVAMLQSWFEMRNMRERILLLLIVLLSVLMLWKAIVFDSLTYNKNISRESVVILQGVRKLEAKLSLIADKIQDSPLKSLQQEVTALQGHNKALTSNIAQRTAQLIPPKDMVALLYDILRDSKLEIIKINNLPESSLFSAEVINESDAGLQVYKHGLELVLRGNFKQTIRFLEKLESLKWKLLWGDFSYDVKQHPIAEIRLVVHTLSLSTGWVGV
ncbi:MAG: hypothetical protein COC15_00355 [Legionellales bacterium]|nr:MAG: hypothetical protein COC15_00355 [Legionellales bacterium]